MMKIQRGVKWALVPNMCVMKIAVVLFLCMSTLCLASPHNDDDSKSDEELPPSHDVNQEVGAPHQAGPVNKEEMIRKDVYGHLLEQGRLDVGFVHAFVASMSVIIVSELGDKTFFIAAIMAMRHSRSVIFAGAISALGFMTIMSACLGYATTVIPRWFTYYASSALFAIFGIKMLKEGYHMSPDEGQEEYEEVQAELRHKEEEMDRGAGDVEKGGFFGRSQRRILHAFISPVFISAFTLTFLAEWGDRSQIATIILGAREEVIGVILGGTLGHALCTGLAVLGGRFIAQRISIRTVTLVGGVVFIIFALSAFFINPDE